MATKVTTNDILEVCGILRMLSEDRGQSLVSSKRAMELNRKLRSLI
jgi:hypothetical protein